MTEPSNETEPIYEVRERSELGRFEFQYCPCGGPVVLSCAENVFGDTNAVFHPLILSYLHILFLTLF